MPRRTHGNEQARMQGRPGRGRSTAQGGRQPAAPPDMRRSTARDAAEQSARAERRAAASGAPYSQQGPAHPVRQGTPPQGRAQSQTGHAPIYDQDEGYRGYAPPSAAQSAAYRQNKARRRLTQAEMRRRKLRRRLVTALLIFLVIAAGIALSIVLLFKVSKFEVQNLDGTAPADTGVYTEEQIIEALGIEQGANLFSFRTADKVAVLNANFPLLENIEIRRRIPDAVVVRVQPAVESYCIQTDAGWAVLSRHLKVISLVGEQPELPVLLGTIGTVPQQGQALMLDTPETETALNQLLDALDAAGLGGDVTQIDFRDEAEVSFLYQGRIRIQLGTINSLDYKLEWTAYILLNENGDGCSASDTGVLDVSHLRTDGTIRPTFAQGDPNAEPTPQPEAPAADSAASDAASASSAPSSQAQPAA